ncbi:unnamed protein product [Brassica napus]|uniref:inositol oxygenase n=1 Tax=Brassica napus TaxID=3708 RepID=A0A816XYQ9_BRANA|nr:unnamed protein product [Brassica napus]
MLTSLLELVSATAYTTDKSDIRHDEMGLNTQAEHDRLEKIVPQQQRVGFAALHKSEAYKHLMNNEDRENMKWLKVFNKYDLYGKSKVRINVEEVKSYYISLIIKDRFNYQRRYFFFWTLYNQLFLLSFSEGKMGQQQSKGELLFEQVSYGNSEGIQSLHREGADLEWMDREGKTPLIMACMNSELYDVAETLIELGANVNAYCPARHAGTPLHHAAKRGFENIVKLLLSHCGVSHMQIHLFSMMIARHHLRSLESKGSAMLYVPLRYDHLLLLTCKWVVIVPTGSRNPSKPFKLELVIYASLQEAQPRAVMPLWKANLEEPKPKQSDTSVIIVENSRIPRRRRQRRKRRHQVVRQTRLRLAPFIEGDEQQLKWFCDACKGIPQTTHPSNFLQTAPSAPPLHHAMSETPNANHHSIDEASSSTTPPPPPPPPSSGKASTSGLNSHESVIVHEPSPSVSPLTDDDDVQTPEEGPFHYPTIDSTPVDVPSSYPLPASAEGEKKEDGISGQCSICLDAPSDTVCTPCGHVAGCMSCLTEIKSKNYGCPVCRAKIDQITKLYRV